MSFVNGRGVNFVTLTGSSLTHHVALPDHGVGLDGQSCSCLIVGWPVGLSSPTLGVGGPSVMFLFDCWPVGRPMLRTVRGCYSRDLRALPPELARDEEIDSRKAHTRQPETTRKRGETDLKIRAI
ncbi:hypothetical protein F2Q68_00001735 [Brassica cretica]|uniref:Uncharacterized protein n=1 Tax=Brassica cretica TaxID=69181 RepID=A0A8S9JAS3_BRACR|nr:hypothetical protein F2Q68_00001735 [Brassica cretica]